VELANILFLYSVTNKSVGYRQGMHELLAPLYQVVDYDSIPHDADTQNLDPAMLELCSKVWVTADAWALFEAVMRGISRWYEWRESPVIQNPSSSPLYSHVHFHVSGESSEIRPYVAPIVETCNRIQSTFLKSVDPLLYKKMLAAGIEPQIYGMYAVTCYHLNTEADDASVYCPQTMAPFAIYTRIRYARRHDTLGRPFCVRSHF
jgi:TBC1 domain family protein 5